MSITPLMPVYPRCGFRPVRGEGAWLISEDGSRALDFAAGIAVHHRDTNHFMANALSGRHADHKDIVECPPHRSLSSGLG